MSTNYISFITSMQMLGSVLKRSKLVTKELAGQIDRLTGKGEYSAVIKYLENANNAQFFNPEAKGPLDLQTISYIEPFILKISNREVKSKNTNFMYKSIW